MMPTEIFKNVFLKKQYSPNCGSGVDLRFFLDKPWHYHCHDLQATRVFGLVLQDSVLSFWIWLLAYYKGEWISICPKTPDFFPSSLKIITLLAGFSPLVYRKRISEMHSCVQHMIFYVSSLAYWIRAEKRSRPCDQN